MVRDNQDWRDQQYPCLVVLLKKEVSYGIVKKQNCFVDKLSDVDDWVSEIKLWMERNMLKLNDNKTEFIVFKPNRSVVAGESIHISCTAVKISSEVKNLGVIPDQSLSVQSHVNTIARVCYSQNIENL